MSPLQLGPVRSHIEQQLPNIPLFSFPHNAPPQNMPTAPAVPALPDHAQWHLPHKGLERGGGPPDAGRAGLGSVERDSSSELAQGGE